LSLSSYSLMHYFFYVTCFHNVILLTTTIITCSFYYALFLQWVFFFLLYGETLIYHFWWDCGQQTINVTNKSFRKNISCVRDTTNKKIKFYILYLGQKKKTNKHITTYVNKCGQINFCKMSGNWQLFVRNLILQKKPVTVPSSQYFIH